MFVLVLGGSGSGKSEYAEMRTMQLREGSVIYLATMMSFDEECCKRIERHKQMRKEKNFDTLECYTHLEQVCCEKDTTIILECMSNLVANECYSEYGRKENTVAHIKAGIENLVKQSANVIVVSNNVFEDGMVYSKETQAYLQILGKINQEMGMLAEEVVEIVHGIVVPIKQ